MGFKTRETANIILNNERLKAFPEDQEKKRITT